MEAGTRQRQIWQRWAMGRSAVKASCGAAAENGRVGRRSRATCSWTCERRGMRGWLRCTSPTGGASCRCGSFLAWERAACSAALLSCGWNLTARHARRRCTKHPCVLMCSIARQCRSRPSATQPPTMWLCVCVQERGFIIVGSFGDQFSDLDGTSSAQASFKLPNPWYYIM